MTVELTQAILHEAGIGNFFRPSQLESLGIPYHRLRKLEADEAVERIGWGLYRLSVMQSQTLTGLRRNDRRTYPSHPS